MGEGESADLKDGRATSQYGPVAIAVASAGRPEEDPRASDWVKKLRAEIEKLFRERPLQAGIQIVIVIVVAAVGFYVGKSRPGTDEQKVTLAIQLPEKAVGGGGPGPGPVDVSSEVEQAADEICTKHPGLCKAGSQSSPQIVETKPEIITVPEPIIYPQTLNVGQLPSRDAETIPVAGQASPLSDIPIPTDVVTLFNGKADVKPNPLSDSRAGIESNTVTATFTYGGVEDWADYCRAVQNAIVLCTDQHLDATYCSGRYGNPNLCNNGSPLKGNDGSPQDLRTLSPGHFLSYSCTVQALAPPEAKTGSWDCEVSVTKSDKGTALTATILDLSPKTRKSKTNKILLLDLSFQLLRFNYQPESFERHYRFTFAFPTQGEPDAPVAVFYTAIPPGTYGAAALK
jgi:hypothetical protein